MKVETNILLETGTNELEIIEFILRCPDKNGEFKNQSFGINVAKVREIIRMVKLTSMPNMPDSVYGIFNLRDKLIPALDLSKYLYGFRNDDKNRKMIIAEFNKIKCGFIVHDVTRIHRVSWNDIETPDTLESINTAASTIIGIIEIKGRTILMLDVEKILADIDPKSAIDTTIMKDIVERKPKVITAEDSHTIRKMITDRLQIAGFEVHSFNDGNEAWKALEEISNEVNKGKNITDLVNLIITDIEMPKLDGYSLVKQIKNDPNLKSLPVVIFSSIINEDNKHRGESVGVDAQLSKPQIGELLDVARYLMTDKARVDS